MTEQLKNFDKSSTAGAANEPEVESYATKFLTGLGYHLKYRKTGVVALDKHWPSKAASPKSPGAPDILIYISSSDVYPYCVWESKGPTESINDALAEAKFYVEGLHNKKPLTPGLPRLAAAFNGGQLRLAYFNHEKKWFPVRAEGNEVSDAFPIPKFLANGISSSGNFLAASGLATASDLRKVLPALRTIYRSIPLLAAGRRPIDFTVALLTLRMLAEIRLDWGSWAEQPGLAPGAASKDEAIGERFTTLLRKVFKDPDMRQRYGDIFKFAEKSGANKEEIAFSFEECLKEIDPEAGFFSAMFDVLDGLPPLHGADFDVFGEVYQAIGDDATKKALGEFFTGRHIISAVVPVLLERAGVKSFEHGIEGKTVADIACGTGGFLTETLRHVRRTFALKEDQTKSFAQHAFFGYDLSHSNASRARVNMYFAGDGFSLIEGGIDTLGTAKLPCLPKTGFDFILTNPPYGSSAQYQRTEETFLAKLISLLKPGAGWGLIVLPTGTLENPRSAKARLELLRKARLTDVVALPKHAFAPYTMQRTAILIFQRREKELAATDWQAVVKEIGSETVSLFIVDNDGFANSDKRYETTRTAQSGEWLHNDLAGWIDPKDGSGKRGKLFSAAIYGILPKSGHNEFGVPLGKKHSQLTVKKMFGFSTQKGSANGRGITFLPDTYLRAEFSPILLADFIDGANHVIGFLGGSKVSLPTTLEEAVKGILSTPIDCVTGTGPKSKPKKIKDMFHLKKGNQGLTEAVIYGQADPKGIWVYGGGEALPRFRILKESKNNKGVPITVHNGPALIVAMDGSSGAVRVVKTGFFCCNHHACVLKLKSDQHYNLYAVAQQIEGGLRALASNKGGSATLTLPFLEEFEVHLPVQRRDVLRIASRRKILSTVRDKFFGN